MKKLLYSLALVLAFGIAGCQDLAVENQNNPNRELALKEPGDVEQLIAGTWDTWWSATQWSEMAMLLTTMADENSSAWANWGMRDLSSEPRVAYDNDPSYARSTAAESSWFRCYTGISNANDGLQSIEAEPERFTQAGININRAKAFAKFTQGLCHGWLALYYDRAFIVDETVDLQAVALGQAELNLSPYNEVMDAAIGMLETTIALSQANSFDTGTDWIFGVTLSSGELAQLAHSYIARFKAQVARDPAERAAVNWNDVLNHVNSGITSDFIPVGDDDGNREWSSIHFYGQDGNTWSRADYYTIGPADESTCDGGDGKINCYQEWLGTPVESRLVWDVKSRDRRLVGDPVDLTVDGKYFEYKGDNGPFPAARGTYNYSSHTHKRYREYNTNGANGPMPAMLMAEMDMLRAEALLHTGGSKQTVADLINKTRVANGELPAATANNATGSINDGHTLADNASLWALMKYEKLFECFQTSGGLAFYDKRGWGDLVSGTLIHFPVPGSELETLALDNYTFGGGGAGSAPKDGKPARPDRFARPK